MYVCMYAYIYVYIILRRATCAQSCVLGSKDSLQDLILSFQHVSSGIQTQVIMVESTSLAESSRSPVSLFSLREISTPQESNSFSLSFENKVFSSPRVQDFNAQTSCTYSQIKTNPEFLSISADGKSRFLTHFGKSTSGNTVSFSMGPLTWKDNR